MKDNDGTLLRHVAASRGWRSNRESAAATDAGALAERDRFGLCGSFSGRPAKFISHKFLSLLRKGSFKNDLERGKKEMSKRPMNLAELL
jgi:hypothetical protein